MSALIRHWTASCEMDFLAGLWRLVRSLHRLSAYIFELSFPYMLHAHTLLALLQPLFWVRVSRQVAWIWYIYANSAFHAQGWNGFPCRLVEVGAFIAQTNGLHFWTLYSLRFMLICYLHKCNLCSGLGLAANWREFDISALIRHSTASGDMDLLTGLWRLVRSLHRLMAYIFELSIPYASCSDATCIQSTTFVPG